MRPPSTASRISALTFCVVIIALLSNSIVEKGSATSFCLSEAFNVAPSFSMGNNPFAIKTADFNADGNPDFATANHTSQDIAVRFGNGNGTFGPVATYPVGRSLSLATADFNSDGFPDFVVGVENPGGPYLIRMLSGNGAGTFGAAVTVGDVGSFAPTDMVAADLNGDGNMDLAVIHLNVTLFMGNGAGAFVNQVGLSSGFPPNLGHLTSLQVTDINGDGNLDVAVAGVRTTNDTGVFKVFLADGAGGFVNGFSLDFPFPSSSMGSGDFNSDGHADFVVSEPRSNLFRLLLGDGHGGFSLSDSATNFETAGFIVVDDFNSDGKLDLALGSGGIKVLLGDGAGGFSFAGAYEVGESGKMAAADFNGDNKQDLIVACIVSFGPNPAVLLLGDGVGGFAGPSMFPFDPEASVHSTAVSDFNRDGNDDAVAGSTEGVVILLGDGTGKLGTPTPTGVVPPPPFSTQSIAAGDFNSDGKPDLAIAQESLKVVLGDGAGGFGPVSSFTIDGAPSDILIADLNLDSSLDLATANRDSNTISVLLGDGAGGFAPAVHYVTGSGAMSVTSGDFNGDGKPDLAAANDFSNNISLLLGVGNGTFAAARNFFVGFSPRSVTAGDFNGDGRSDLAVAVSNSGRIQVFLGTSNGSLQGVGGFNIVGPWHVVAKDVNRDGKLDLIVGTVFEALAVFQGQGTGQFSSPTIYPLNSRSFDTGDFNRDGRIDISLPVFGGLAVILNTCISDFSPPVVTCAAPDGNWHATDVSVVCSAQDEGVGLANPSDSTFTLTTNVPDGTETSNALTSSRTICDALANCRTVGPIGGNKVDKRPPAITIIRPAAETYLVNQVVSASYTCQDGGSGVESCLGPVTNGNPINTSSGGIEVFTVTARDNVGNTASPQTINYSVAYGVVALFDQSKAHKSGSTVPIKVRLVDANGANVSSLSVVLHAVSVVQVGSDAGSVLEDAGSSNPDFDFRYDAAAASYVFNLKTSGYVTGTYAIGFTAGTDPTGHTVLFQVRQ